MSTACKAGVCLAPDWPPSSSRDSSYSQSQSIGGRVDATPARVGGLQHRATFHGAPTHARPEHRVPAVTRCHTDKSSETFSRACGARAQTQGEMGYGTRGMTPVVLRGPSSRIWDTFKLERLCVLSDWHTHPDRCRGACGRARSATRFTRCACTKDDGLRMETR